MAGKVNKTKKKSLLFGITSRVLMLIVAALLALSYLSIVINPAKIWMVSLSGIFFVPLMTLNLLLLIWALKRRSRSFVIPLLALLPSFFFIGRYVQFGSDEDSDRPVSENTVKIMTWNVGRFAMQALTDAPAAWIPSSVSSGSRMRTSSAFRSST